MHHAVYGTGYLATVISSCLADFGLPVTCFHEDVPKISSLARDETPYYEKNLKEVVRRNVRSGRLSFSHDPERTCRKSLMIFLAQDDPIGIEETAARLSRFCSDDHMLVISSPVPVGTAARIERNLRASGSKITIMSHPVFVTDGCAVEDFNWPDRILLGTDSNAGIQAMKMLYRPLVMRGVPVIVTNHETAELARVFRRDAVPSHARLELIERHARIAHERQRLQLVRVELRNVDAHEAHVGIGERGIGRGREIAQSRSDDQHDVRVARQAIRRRRAGHADGAD